MNTIPISKTTLLIFNVKFFSTIFIIFVFSLKLNSQVKGTFNVGEKNLKIDVVEGQLKNLINDVGIPALSLAVFDNNKVVYYNSFGYKQLISKNIVNKRTVFEGASLSKSFLVFVTYKLVEQGKIDLDKPLYQYLEFDSLKYDSRYKQITARMVLSHSSGIENWAYLNNPNKLEIINNPGEKFCYSGEGYNYLANVIETILHKPYVEYVQNYVINPLNLKRTFLVYKQPGLITAERPSNISYGHNSFGMELNKQKNFTPVPSSYNHFTAEDYAKLIISFFNNKNLSEASIKSILNPLNKVRDDFPLYYGTGFEIFKLGSDTFIAHGGYNPGFKAQMFYSVTRKKGLVFLTNGEQGKLIGKELCKLMLDYDLSDYYKGWINEVYPSKALYLLKVYRESNSKNMFDEIDILINNGEIEENTLTDLAYLFTDNPISSGFMLTKESFKKLLNNGVDKEIIKELKPMENRSFVNENSFYKQLKKLIDINKIEKYKYLFFEYSDLSKKSLENHKAIALRLLEKQVKLHPESSYGYYLLGVLNARMRDCNESLYNLSKAKTLVSNMLDIEEYLNGCKQAMEKEKPVKDTIIGIGSAENTKIEAEYFSSMKGGQLRELKKGFYVGYLNTGDWIDYKVDVKKSTEYLIEFRISTEGLSQFQLLMDSTIITTMEKCTYGRDIWVNLATKVNLLSGQHTLRLYSKDGGFMGVDWIRFARE